MEEKENKFDFVKIMFWVVCLFLMVLFGLPKIATIIFCVVCVSALLVYYVFQRIPPSVEILERRICKRLDRQGYQHTKKEGTLYITDNNNHYRIQLCEGYNRRILYPYLERDYPNHTETQTSIGFRQNEP